MKTHPLVIITSISCLFQSAQGQDLNYVYALMNQNGSFHLDEISIDANPGGQMIGQSVILDNLNDYVSGFGSAGRYGENLNGLALDRANQRVYFNYTYGDDPALNSGNYHMQLYRATFDGISWAVDAVGESLSQALAGTTLPDSANVGLGAFPKATFQGGDYYTGGQLKDNLVRFNLTPEGEAASLFVEQWANIDHGGYGAWSGGDILFDHAGNIVVSAVVDVNPKNVIIVQNLVQALDASGLSADYLDLEGAIPYAQEGAVQLGGYGDTEDVYAATVEQGKLFHIDLGTGLAVEQIGQLTGGNVMDLSEGSKISLIPEPSVFGLAAMATLLGATRRKRK